MRRLDINGQLYALPFADLFRELTESEGGALRDSIQVHGVLSPIITYTSDLHGRAVIDGANRGQFAAEFSFEAPLTNLGRISDDAAQEIAESVNADRRHLSADELSARATKRRKRASVARKRGESLRTIAKRERVSPEQIRRDLSGVTGVTPEPGKVRGSDGKAYASKRGEPTPLEMLERTRRGLDRVIEGVAAIAEGPFAARLLGLAKLHGVPLAIENGVCHWPPLTGLRTVRADLAAQAATE